MRVLNYVKAEYQPSELRYDKFTTKVREQGTVVTGTINIGEEKNTVWISGGGISVQSRGLVPTTEYYTKGGKNADNCDWDPTVKGGHSLGLTVGRSSVFASFIGETEKAVADMMVRQGIIKGYPPSAVQGFVKSVLREYERVLTFTCAVDPYTVVKNKEMSSSPHPINDWIDNPLTPGSSVVGMMIQPTFFSVVGGVKGTDPVISVHFKVSRFDVERRLTPEERLESIAKNPEQSHWASVVNTALTWEPEEDSSPILGGPLLEEPSTPPRGSIRAMPPSGGIKKKHADAKKRKADARQYIDDEAIEESDF